MKDQLQTIRAALEQAKQNTTHGQIAWNCKEALAALAQIEAAVGEPVAWAMPKGDGTFIDVITPAEHARDEGSYTVPLFAHPVAQQPQAKPHKPLFADLIAQHPGLREELKAMDKQPQAEVGNSGFDHKTASDFLSGKTVSDEAVRKFVQAARWAHDDRASLQSTLLSVRNELDAREAEITLLKKELMDAEATPQQAEAMQYTRADLDRAYSAGLVEGERLAIQQAEVVQSDVDWPDVEDMAHSALQEALSFGLNHDVFHRFGKSVMQKTRAAIAQQKGGV